MIVDEGDQRDRRISLLIRTRGDQRGPEGPATVMAEINPRTLMINLGREDATDSTTSAKIARYAERQQLAYKLTDEGVLLLDGHGKKIHLRNGVVTLRNAQGLHALPERVTTNVMREEGQRCRAMSNRAEKYGIRWCHLTHQVFAGGISS